MILPPKRYQNPGLPFFDPIRHKAWFKSLERRRAKIPMLSAALSEYELGLISFCSVAEKYKVHERELRGYRGYVMGHRAFSPNTELRITSAIEDAYVRYVEGKASRSFAHCLRKSARLYGMNPRHLTEAWDVDRFFYPESYKDRPED